MIRKTRSYFEQHYKSLMSTRTLRRLLHLGMQGLRKVFPDSNAFSKSDRTLPTDEFLYRSIIYTLFYANFHSASWILRFERKMEGVNFPYIDAELVSRAMLERLIHQYFIMTDPKRLTSLYTAWEIIEYKRYHQAVEKAIAENPESIAAIMEGGQNIRPWSPEQEQQYNDAVRKWEALVSPKQSAAKSRSWSGLSISKMAERVDMTDFYKILYRATSWYSHSLVQVSDFYLHYDEKNNFATYHSAPTREQVDSCLFHVTMIYGLSLRFTGNVLEWDIDEKISYILNEKQNLFKYLQELMISFYD